MYSKTYVFTAIETERWVMSALLKNEEARRGGHQMGQGFHRYTCENIVCLV